MTKADLRDATLGRPDITRCGGHLFAGDAVPEVGYPHGTVPAHRSADRDGGRHVPEPPFRGGSREFAEPRRGVLPATSVAGTHQGWKPGAAVARGAEQGCSLTPHPPHSAVARHRTSDGPPTSNGGTPPRREDRFSMGTKIGFVAGPGYEDESWRLITLQYPTYGLRSTGLYAVKDKEFTVEVTLDGSEAPRAMAISVGPDVISDQAKEARYYTLEPGNNKITDKYGGMVYVSVTGSSAQKITADFSGLREAPYFELGRTTGEQWREMLEKRQTPYAELVSPHLVITVTRKTAITYQDEDQAAVLNALESSATVCEETVGLFGKSSWTPGADDRSPYSEHCVECHEKWSYGYAYAASGHLGFPADQGSIVHVLTSEGADQYWCFAHEFGHHRESWLFTPDDLTDVHNNVLSLAVGRSLGKRSRLLDQSEDGEDHYDLAFKKIDSGTAFNQFDHFERLVMMEQLRLAYGNGFWPKLFTLSRKAKFDKDSRNDQQRFDTFFELACRVAGHDLTEFFTAKWRMPVSREGKKVVADLNLPKPDEDLSKLREPKARTGVAAAAGVAPVPGGTYHCGTQDVRDLVASEPAVSAPPQERRDPVMPPRDRV
ncbi:M60 family metallopeptidase [Actinosynnema sp. NPDC053489]|uniref:M60 family metallopeptidase n=1 Tax=Actinosynnema sp. NPDC053489 TaxID=3363916 RepID=UPI0037C613B8